MAQLRLSASLAEGKRGSPSCLAESRVKFPKRRMRGKAILHDNIQYASTRPVLANQFPTYRRFGVRKSETARFPLRTRVYLFGRLPCLREYVQASPRPDFRVPFPMAVGQSVTKVPDCGSSDGYLDSRLPNEHCRSSRNRNCKKDASEYPSAHGLPPWLGGCGNLTRPKLCSAFPRGLANMLVVLAPARYFRTRDVQLTDPMRPATSCLSLFLSLRGLSR